MAVPNERPITVIPFITVPETVTLEPLDGTPRLEITKILPESSCT